MRLVSIAAASALLVGAAPAVAQQQPAAPAHAFTVTAQVDNDYFTNADHHYTNGLRFSYSAADPWALFDRLARTLEQLPAGIAGAPTDAQGQPARGRISFVLGQNMFTPDGISERALIVDDRPYAGWLYLGMAIHRVGDAKLDSIELDLGVVGPSALGREVQTEWHKLINVGLPMGWDHQLHDEPAVLLTFERKLRDETMKVPVLGLDLDRISSFGAAVGNVYMLADAGMMFRISTDLSP